MKGGVCQWGGRETSHRKKTFRKIAWGGDNIKHTLPHTDIVINRLNRLPGRHCEKGIGPFGGPLRTAQVVRIIVFKNIKYRIKVLQFKRN